MKNKDLNDIKKNAEKLKDYGMVEDINISKDSSNHDMIYAEFTPLKIVEIVKVKMGWQKMETAPRDGKTILVVTNDLVEPVTVAFWSISECCFVTPLVRPEFRKHQVLSHWQPLPLPPSERDITGYQESL